MKSIKRIEIVIDAAHTPSLLKMLREAGAPGYTLVRDVHGSGDRGERTGDHLTDVFRNCMVLLACEPEICPAILDAVRPLLQEFGGICLLSDAQWLKH